MNVNIEYCDPFSGDKSDIWMKTEHCGRYLFAKEYLAKKNVASVVDIAAANGYGSRILSEVIPEVIAADRNTRYLDSDYLNSPRIQTFCFDFDDNELQDSIPPADAVVCFETIEHLKDPFRFLKIIAAYLQISGWLLLSFPNPTYEILNSDGTNQDSYHLHILDLGMITTELQNLGFHILNILGQPVSNKLCAWEHDLIEKRILSKDDINNSFCYDEKSIRVLSRLFAWPLQDEIEKSYSYIIIAQKRT